MVKTINMALQGGGAHGALTWGVLDRLLEEERLEIEGITATSAGAMNAAALKCGWVEDGRDGARKHLSTFWNAVAKRSPSSHPINKWLQVVNPALGMALTAFESGPGYFAGETMTRIFSPYDFNPLNYHPLRDLIGDLDFATMDEPVGPKLFICATNVRSGKIKVFEREEITTDAILASACLPTLFQAIEIDGEAYWDGGYTGNPALFPLFYETNSRDIVIVHINPIEREEVPVRASDILNRINEISFNSSLLRELRNIELIKRLIEGGTLTGTRYKDLLIHSIRDDDTMSDMGIASKLQPSMRVLQNLHDKGYAAADTFLQENWGNLGERSSVDLRAMFE
ncbi:patatin-like phospholipase family protein [Pontivivens nitratireducens]|uniref:patatin-like phospholipase family protein n=1 Tax=Pontivivens nitratireducens TaxID=2758038 RepID=UPI00163AD2BC|nr:patatin-like phospholipase family protein [Pontibrevibacter nitratireducens]